MSKISLVSDEGVLEYAEQAIMTFWLAATSESLAVARWDSPIYKSAEKLFLVSLTAATNSPAHAKRLRTRLSAIGPFYVAAKVEGIRNLEYLIESCNEYRTER